MPRISKPAPESCPFPAEILLSLFPPKSSPDCLPIMAATNETSHPERNRGWYQEDVTEINQPMRDLLENYSEVPSEEVVKHVNNIASPT